MARLMQRMASHTGTLTILLDLWGEGGGSGILGGQVWHGLEGLRFEGPRVLSFGVRVEP